MRAVLHVLNDVRQAGNGIVHAVVDLACTQADRGDDVLIASAGGEYVALLEHHGVRHVTVPDVRQPRRLVKSAAQLRALVREHRAEVVHAHMNYSALVCRLAVTGTPARLVSSAHTSFKPEAALLAVSDLVIAVSAAVGEGMRRRGVPRSRVRVVPNGTVGSPRTAGETGRAALAHPAVLTVAGLYQRKGIDLLISAFQQVAQEFPDAHLYVAGGGPEHETLLRQAAATSVADRIHLLGYRQDVGALLRGADVFVLASRREPFGLVLVEAREAGCAVVAADVDGIPEVCDFGRAGLLVPGEDVDALAGALRTLLGDPAALARWRAAAGQGLEAFTVARVADGVDVVYAELLSRPRARQGSPAPRLP